RNRNHGVDAGAPHRSPEHRVSEDRCVVGKADEGAAQGSCEIDIKEAGIERIGDWKHRDEREHQEHRQKEDRRTPFIVTDTLDEACQHGALPRDYLLALLRSAHFSAASLRPTSGVALSRKIDCQTLLLVSFHSLNQGEMVSFLTAIESC